MARRRRENFGHFECNYEWETLILSIQTRILTKSCDVTPSASENVGGDIPPNILGGMLEISKSWGGGISPPIPPKIEGV